MRMRHQIRVLLLTTALVVALGAPFDQSAPASDARRGTENHDAPEQTLAIIVNRSNSVDELSREELRAIFLGERGYWPNGRRITLVMMEPDQPERKALLHEICQMTEAEYNRRLLHGLFTGELFVSPKTLATPTGVRKFVFNVPGAIGYLRSSDVDGSVKVVRVDGHLPDDREYSLRLRARDSVK